MRGSRCKEKNETSVIDCYRCIPGSWFNGSGRRCRAPGRRQELRCAALQRDPEQEPATNPAVTSSACRSRRNAPAGGQPLAGPDRRLGRWPGAGVADRPRRLGRHDGQSVADGPGRLRRGLCLAPAHPAQGRRQYAVCRRWQRTRGCPAAFAGARHRRRAGLRRASSTEHPRRIRHRRLSAPGQAQFRQAAGGA